MSLRIPASPSKLVAFPVPTVGTRARALDIAAYPRLARALGLDDESGTLAPGASPAPVRIALDTLKLH